MHTKNMKALGIFYFKQILLLGSIGFTIFHSIAWLQVGWFWTSDALLVWLLSLIIVASYLFFVAFPVLWGTEKLKLNKWAILLSTFSGLLTVFVCMVVFSRRQPSLYNYFIWPWNMYLIFGVIGFLHGMSYVKNKNA